MKTRWIVALAVLLLALFALRPRPRPAADAPDPVVNVPVSTAEPARTAAAASSTAPASAASPGTSATPPPTQPVPAGEDPPPPPGTPAPLIAATPDAVREAMDNVQFALRDYRTVLGENPIGTNAEITKTLTGDNLKQVKIPIPAGSSLNGEGEMCDRWGTPYFFHQLSGKQMEIHSAGPDLKMGTGDDLVVK